MYFFLFCGDNNKKDEPGQTREEFYTYDLHILYRKKNINDMIETSFIAKLSLVLLFSNHSNTRRKAITYLMRAHFDFRYYFTPLYTFIFIERYF